MKFIIGAIALIPLIVFWFSIFMGGTVKRREYYFPEGYYERFLEDNDLKNTKEARIFFKKVFNISKYHGEEFLEDAGNYLAQLELTKYNPRLKKLDK